jgi:hypothetical protein
MTVKAYVLIETQVGRTKQVVDTIRKLQGVVLVDIVQAETLNDIGTLLVEKVHPVAGISRTVTCVAL